MFQYMVTYRTKSHLVQNVTLKLQKVSTGNFVHRYISLCRSTVHKNSNSALPYIGVIALCSFLHFELSPERNSKTTRGINSKLCR